MTKAFVVIMTSRLGVKANTSQVCVAVHVSVIVRTLSLACVAVHVSVIVRTLSLACVVQSRLKVGVAVQVADGVGMLAMVVVVSQPMTKVTVGVFLWQVYTGVWVVVTTLVVVIIVQSAVPEIVAIL